MKTRKYYFNFDKGAVDALDASIEACREGDIPDFTLGIISDLTLRGYVIVKKDKKND